ncbi:hypothetical protein GW17_00013895, partial [Ensete ventricosum]
GVGLKLLLKREGVKAESTSTQIVNRGRSTEVSLLVEADAVVVKHEKDCLVQDSTLMRRDQAVGGGGRDNTPLSPTAAGPPGLQFCNVLFDGVVVVEFEDAVASSCTKKTTVMSATQVVFCNALFDGVVGVEFEDAVVGSVESLDFEYAVVGSCAKKTMARVADGDKINDHQNLLEVRHLSPLEALGSVAFGERCLCHHRNRQGHGEEEEAPEGRSNLKKRAMTKICCLSARSSGALGRRGTRSIRMRLRECLQGWRPRVPRLPERWQGRRLGRWPGRSRGGGFHWRMCRRRLLSLSIGFQEIYSNEKEKVATLTVRSCSAAATSQYRNR